MKRIFIILIGASCIASLIIIFFTGPETSKKNKSRSRPKFIEDSSKESRKLLDLKSFNYILDANCNKLEYHDNLNPQERIVWIITSYAGDPSKRSALRQAYNSAELKRLGIRRVFLLGTLDDSAEKKTGVSQNAIINEAQRFNDIVQGNFIEAYKNLTYKHMMGLQWATDKCRNSFSYIMKMDDDIIVNLYEAMDLLKKKSKVNFGKPFLMGYVLDHMSPIRNKLSKWYVSNDEFSGQVYTAFLSGWCYWVDMNTAMKLINQSLLTEEYFWIDDLFITGILREKAGIRDIINVNNVFTTDYRFLICCLKNDVSFVRYKCDYVVGPDGDQSNLLMTFQRFSQSCYYRYKCSARPKEKSISNKCILDAGNSNLDVGNAFIEEVSLETNSLDK